MQLRILEATPNIPIGTIVEVDEFAKGTAIEKEVNGVQYRFEIDGVIPLEDNKFKIYNSNVVAIVEVINA